MRVCGIIAEYDPFHKGHLYHLSQARKMIGADAVVCVMSGSFTQRGSPALLSAHTRAEMALRCGADIVLQLPYAFSVREAEFFALGGVSILQALGCVTHLAFGCECTNLPLLSRAASLLEAPDDALNAALRSGLNEGLSHAAALGRAVDKRLGLTPGQLSAPNTALAISYLRALLRLGSAIQPVLIPREGAYHAKELGAFSSASAVRAAILRGDWAGVAQAIPAPALPPLRRALAAGEICPPDALDAALRRALLLTSPQALAALPGVSEGLEQRILRAAEKAVTRQELIAQIKTRRYIQGRISRVLCHALLSVKREELPSLPSYARVLGFRKSAQPLLRSMQDSGFPLVCRPAREAGLSLDLRADDMWRIGAGLPRGDTFMRPPVILP